MQRLLITGGHPLKGTVAISGAKNAALPIIMASLLIDGAVTLHNVPRLNDIFTLEKIMSHIGVHIKFVERHTLHIQPNTLNTLQVPYELVKTMRASVLALGPLLARYGEAEVSLPGGCAIGARPVDLHIKGMAALGATVQIKEGYIRAQCKGRLQGADITMDLKSVTGTENIMIAAVLARGTTVIRNAAREPEVIDLANYLNTVGAQIKGAGTDTITIDGVETLTGGEYTVMPDRIEAGTFLVAAVMTQGSVRLTSIQAQLLSDVIDKLRHMGADITVGDDEIVVTMKKRPKAIDITTAPFPGFPTDMQAQFMALNAVAQGHSRFVETIFENRFMHVQELVRMGANLTVRGNVVTCHGIQELTGAPVMASDLRASSCLVLAGLVAQGETIVERIYHLDRGYEHLEQKLTALGANVKRFETTTVGKETTIATVI